jgi:dihydroxyacetone kinase-like predicted kinase
VDRAASVEDNVERLSEVLADVRIGSVAPAARDDAQSRFSAGDAVGFVGDQIVSWGEPDATLARTMAGLVEQAEILTVIGGSGAPIALDQLQVHAPDGVELELHDGGQPHYWWLLAAE